MFTPVKNNIEMLKFALSEIVAGGEDHFNDHGYSLVGDNNQGFEVSLLEVCEASLARISELEEREQALAAHVERLRKAALDAIHYLPGGEIKAELRDAYDDTPETSLIRRDLIKQADGVDYASFKWPPGSATRSRLTELADELRQRAQGIN